MLISTYLKTLFFLSGLVISPILWANPAAQTIDLSVINSQNSTNKTDTINVSETKYGLLFVPAIKGLSPGLHNFYIASTDSCEPKNVLNLPLTQNNSGHLYDLCAIFVNTDGIAVLPVLATHIQNLSAVEHHALVIANDYTSTSSKEPILCGTIA